MAPWEDTFYLCLLQDIFDPKLESFKKIPFQHCDFATLRSRAHALTFMQQGKLRIKISGESNTKCQKKVRKKGFGSGTAVCLKMQFPIKPYHFLYGMFHNTRGLAYHQVNVMTKMHRMSQYPLYMHHRIECVYSAFLKMLPPLFNNENGYQKLRGMLGDTKHAPRVRHQSFHCKKSFPPKLKASPNYGDVHNVR